jgi:hypothetical protein
MPLQSKQIQEGLAWMGMPPISSVEHMPRRMAADKVGYPGAAVSNHQNSGSQSIQRPNGVQQRFSFGDAAGRGVNIGDVFA